MWYKILVYSPLLPCLKSKKRRKGKEESRLLLNLHVKNLAIIDEIDVDFTGHFNVMTGETGAGKSIIIDSINMALGAKVSKDMIREGAEYALVELVFSVETKEQAAKIQALDLSVEDGQLVITRKLMNGRSMSKVNGEHVTNAILKELAGILIDIHGQHEHQSLLYKSKHLEIVDRFAKEQAVEEKGQLEAVYQKYRDLKKELQSYDMPEEERLRELSFMEYEYQEIMNAKLAEGEEEELAAKHKRLSNAGMIAEGMGNIYTWLSDNPESVTQILARSVRQSAKLAEYDEELQGIYEQLEQIETLSLDVVREIHTYMQDVADYSEELAETERRLDLIRGLQARFGKTVEDVLQYAGGLEEKIKKYQDYDERRQKLNAEIAACEEELENISARLSAIRKKEAAFLQEKITQALIDLNFLEVRFQIEFAKTESYSANGYDDVEFLIATNPGEPVRPLGKVASGGELSRIMLAIKAVLAEEDEIPSLIFDEIDVGISGRTAQKVSEKLAYISKSHQVLCITHLAQIAAMSDSHYLIEKFTQSDRTQTSIRRINEEETIQELARIAGGAQITDSVLASAKEIREMAKEYKSNV